MRKLWLVHKYVNGRWSGPVSQQSFEMHLEPVDLNRYSKDIASYGFETSEISTVNYEGTAYPISQVNIPGEAPAKRLLILGGVHGNEIAGTLAILDILDDAKTNPSSYKEWNIRIVTPINPVGVVFQSRFNESGHDLNRDFEHFETPGAQIVRNTIDEFKPDVIVSFHEGPQDGFFVIAEKSAPPDLKQGVLDSLRRHDVPLARKNFLGLPIPDGWWQKTRLAYGVQRLLGMHSLGRYTNERGIPLLTTESPWGSPDLATRRRGHLAVVRGVVTPR